MTLINFYHIFFYQGNQLLYRLSLIITHHVRSSHLPHSTNHRLSLPAESLVSDEPNSPFWLDFLWHQALGAHGIHSCWKFPPSRHPSSTAVSWKSTIMSRLVAWIVRVLVKIMNFTDFIDFISKETLFMLALVPLGNYFFKSSSKSNPLNWYKGRKLEKVYINFQR